MARFLDLRVRSHQWPARALPIALGFTVGVALVVYLAGSKSAPPKQPSAAAATTAQRVIDGAHNPPLLVMRGEPVVLECDYICVSEALSGGQPCQSGGEVHVMSPVQERLPLHAPDAKHEWRLWTHVPPHLLQGEVLTYYATLRDSHSGATLTLPEGGDLAPTRLYVPNAARTVALTPDPLTPSSTVVADVLVQGNWGSGPDEFGRTGGDGEIITGPTSFAFDRHGALAILDAANSRLVRPASEAKVLPLPGAHGIADLDFAPNNDVLVLDEAARPTPTITRFDRSTGARLFSIRVTSRADELRVSDAGAGVHGMPSDVWERVVNARSHALPRGSQLKSGVSGVPSASARR